MFKGMKYVYEVYKTKNISRAAENLYISQPSLSATIKKIEKKVGMPLFDRSTTPLSLTECGKQYIKTAEKIMDLEDEFASYVGNVHELNSGHLSLGGSYFYSSFVLPSIIDKFWEKYPKVRVSLFEGHSLLLEQKLFAGELDMIIDNCQLSDTIYEKLFFQEEHLLLAVPAAFHSNDTVRKYQLTSEDVRNDVHLREDFPGVPLKKFERDPFVVLRARNDTRERVEEICRRENVKLNYALRLNQLLTTYHMTESGVGVSFVSDNVVKSLPENPGVIYYKLDAPEADRKVWLYYRKNKYLTKSMQEFIKIVIPESTESTTKK